MYSAGIGAPTDDNGGMQYGTTNTYSTSYVKSTVDAWKKAQAPVATEARLISKEDIDNNFGYEEYDPCGGCGAKSHRISKIWMYNDNYWYWTMSPKTDSNTDVWFVASNGNMYTNSSNYYDGSHFGFVRPVIVLPKSAL